MGQSGHATDHQIIAATLNTYHGTSLDETIDATSIIWDEGWVHPTYGNDSYDGATPQSPKQTIGAALSAGYRVIHVAAGTHTWTGTGIACTLIFHIGIHTFSNAPVVCTGQINLIGVVPPPDHTVNTVGCAVIKASGSPTDIFQLDNGGAQRWASAVRNLKFDAETVTRSAVYSDGLNTIDMDFNVIYAASGWQPNVYMLYSTAYLPGSTTDQSWGRITRNTCRGAGLCYYNWQMDWINRVAISENRGWAGSSTRIQNPFVVIEAGNSQGHWIVGNSFEGSGTTGGGVDNTPLMYLSGKHNQLYFIGNAQEKVDTTDHIAYKLGDTTGQVKNSIIHHSIGDTGAKGYISIGGVTYTQGTYKSPDSTDSAYFDTYRNSIIIAGRTSY